LPNASISPEIVALKAIIRSKRVAQINAIAPPTLPKSNKKSSAIVPLIIPPDSSAAPLVQSKPIIINEKLYISASIKNKCTSAPIATVNTKVQIVRNNTGRPL
jgi:hypothetical protein